MVSQPVAVQRDRARILAQIHPGAAQLPNHPQLAPRDRRVGDFAIGWRGKYDEVVRGYEQVSPLDPEEWALITPLWWAFLIEDACRHLRAGTQDDGWIAAKLRQRSPLMGPDALE